MPVRVSFVCQLFMFFRPCFHTFAWVSCLCHHFPIALSLSLFHSHSFYIYNRIYRANRNYDGFCKPHSPSYTHTHQRFIKSKTFSIECVNTTIINQYYCAGWLLAYSCHDYQFRSSTLRAWCTCVTMWLRICNMMHIAHTSCFPIRFVDWMTMQCITAHWKCHTHCTCKTRDEVKKKKKQQPNNDNQLVKSFT